jgi:hypothetical protein
MPYATNQENIYSKVAQRCPYEKQRSAKYGCEGGEWEQAAPSPLVGGDKMRRCAETATKASSLHILLHIRWERLLHELLAAIMVELARAATFGPGARPVGETHDLSRVGDAGSLAVGAVARGLEGGIQLGVQQA